MKIDRTRLCGILLLAVAACGGGSDSNSSAPSNTPAPVASITVSASATSVFVGSTISVTALLRDANGNALVGRTVSWASTNASVATVSSFGVVSGVAAGSATITATSEGVSGSTTIIVSVVPVTNVTITTTFASVFAGSIQQLFAVTYGANGYAVTGRPVTWSSANTNVATVTSTGILRGIAVGNTTISASSEGVTGTVGVAVSAVPANVIVTGLHDPVDFATHCPTDDPAFAVVQQDFVLLSDGVPSTTPIACTNPYSTTSPVTEELMEWQALRLMYTMSPGTAGKLPWTNLSLYDWLKAQIAGIDIHTAAGNSACCETINGKRYFFTTRKDAATLLLYRDWLGLSGWIGLVMHEARHVTGPGHTTGCPSFPLPSDPAGCDATYDLQNLGSYGVQYWFFSSIALGTFSVGIGCLPSATAQSYATSAANSANGYPNRFVTNAPPRVTATTPYGGPCYPP